MDQTEEKDLFKAIQNNDEEAFEKLFHKYYGHLCLFASRILLDDEAAEEIVQDFFVKLWEKRVLLFVETSVRSYFYRSVRNQCLNLIEHNKIKYKHVQSVLSEAKNNQTLQDNFTEIDLAKKIEESIQSLPKKRQNIFRLSREEGLKYREIAEKLNISVKTVEAQMGLAIKYLKDKLKNYHTFFTLFVFFNKK